MALVPYHDVMQSGGANFAHDPDSQLKAFSARSYQRGMGLGGTLSGFLKYLAPLAKKAALSLGKNALAAGAQVAQDVLDKKDVRGSLKDHLKSAVLSTGRDLVGEFVRPSQSGAGSMISPRSHFQEERLTEPDKMTKHSAAKRKRQKASRERVPKSKKRQRHLKHADIFN